MRFSSATHILIDMSGVVQILVTFSEKRPKKSWFAVYMGEEDVPWEQWYVCDYHLRELPPVFMCLSLTMLVQDNQCRTTAAEKRS